MKKQINHSNFSFKKIFFQVDILFLSPKPKKIPEKRGGFWKFLTTRFIAEKFYSNKTCGFKKNS